MNNDLSQQLQPIIEGIFNNYFYFDKKVPHSFYTKDITIHNPVEQLIHELTALISNVVQASIESVKTQEVQKAESNDIDSNQVGDLKLNKTPTADEKKAKTNLSNEDNYLDNYYDYYLDDVES